MSWYSLYISDGQHSSVGTYAWPLIGWDTDAIWQVMLEEARKAKVDLHHARAWVEELQPMKPKPKPPRVGKVRLHVRRYRADDYGDAQAFLS